MRFFLKKDLYRKMFNFKPEEHPYEYSSKFPIRHGLLKTGEIYWAFWCRREFWTFDQAVRLLDDELVGDDTYNAMPWPFYSEVSQGLEKVPAASINARPPRLCAWPGSWPVCRRSPGLRSACGLPPARRPTADLPSISFRRSS